MRIALNCLHLGDGASGSALRYGQGAVRALCEALPEPPVIFLPSRASNDWLPARCIIKRVHWPFTAGAGRFLYTDWVLGRMARRYGAQLLHALDGFGSFNGPPLVLSVADPWALRAPPLVPPQIRKPLHRFLPRGLATASHVLVPSAYVRDELLRWNDKRKQPREDLPGRMRIVPPGIDPIFKPVAEELLLQAVRTRYNLPEKYILSVGRVSPRKNAVRVIEVAFAARAASGIAHKLVLAGPTGWGATDDTARAIRQLDMAAHTVDCGYVPDADLPALYTLADVVIQPSYSEGFPYAALEAMACGVPVIAADAPGMRDSLGQAARLVPAGDLAALREALEQVLGQPKTAQTMRKNGVAHAADFTWQRFATQTIRAYREAIEKG